MDQDSPVEHHTKDEKYMFGIFQIMKGVLMVAEKPSLAQSISNILSSKKCDYRKGFIDWSLCRQCMAGQVSSHGVGGEWLCHEH